MSKLEDLFTPVRDLTPEQLRDRIRQIRTERRIYKEPRSVRKTRVAKEANAASRIEKLIGALSPEEIANLIKSMEAQSDT